MIFTLDVSTNIASEMIPTSVNKSGLEAAIPTHLVVSNSQDDGVALPDHVILVRGRQLAHDLPSNLVLDGAGRLSSNHLLSPLIWGGGI